MIDKELTEFIKLNRKFNDSAARVCKLLERMNDEYQYIDSFQYDESDSTVYCEGGYSYRGEYNMVTTYFPSCLLTMTDNDVNKWIDEKISQNEKAIEDITQKSEREADMREYQRIKEKYNL